MGDHSADAATGQDQHRSTSQGRHYGDISYAAEEQAHAEDLRRRASVGIHVDQVPVHWTERPSRSTGARRRII